MRVVSLPYYEKMLLPALTADPSALLSSQPHRLSDSALAAYLDLARISLSCEGGPNPHIFETQTVLLRDLICHVFASDSASVRGSFLALLRGVFARYPCVQRVPSFLDESGYLSSLLEHIQRGLATPLNKVAGAGAGTGAGTAVVSPPSHTPRGGGYSANKDVSALMFALQCADCVSADQSRLTEVFGAALLRIAHQLLGEHVARAVRYGVRLWVWLWLLFS